MQWGAVIIAELFHLLEEGPRAWVRCASSSGHTQEEQAFANLKENEWKREDWKRDIAHFSLRALAL